MTGGQHQSTPQRCVRPRPACRRIPKPQADEGMDQRLMKPLRVRERRSSRYKGEIDAAFGRCAPPRNGAELEIYFVDDSRQRRPTRPAMGELIAIGGIGVPVDYVRDLSSALDQLCEQQGMPRGEKFKWSPGPELWMRKNLIGEARTNFYSQVVALLKEAEVEVIVVIEDTKYERATDAPDAEMDVFTMFIERANNQCAQKDTNALLIVDRPSGDRKDEDRFLGRCLEVLESGTDYVQPGQFIHSILSTPSRLSRLLQAADVVTGATLAFVSGENQYSPVLFEALLPLFCRLNDRCGGVGLKIHPDFIHGNLYHWIAGDTHLYRGSQRVALPEPGRQYASSANQR